jgi:hypothetical protein
MQSDDDYSMSHEFLPADQFPPSLAPKSIFFRPSYRGALCWLVGTCAYVIVVGFNSKRPPSVMAFVMSILITGAAIGIFMWLLAGAARRVFKRTVAEANLFFCMGIFAFAVSGMIGQIRAQHAMKTARDDAYAALAEARASRATSKPVVAPSVAPVNPFRPQALAARKQFLTADKYLREKSAAQSAVGLMQEGKPWRWIDKTVETRSAEFKSAYQAWRAAEIKAGTDPTVSNKEFAAIANLHAIRMAIAKYRLKNEKPPTLRNIATLPANPITGQKTVTRAGIATAAHGWSYDEYTGRIRIVLPAGAYGGLHRDEIEIVKAGK